MAKFIYLGKKKNFKLSNSYQFSKELNHGDVFELEGNDCVLMKKCIDVSKMNGSKDDELDFMLYSSHIARQEESELNNVVKEVKKEAVVPVSNGKIYSNSEEIQEEPKEDAVEGREVTVNLALLRKQELIDICAEKGIEVPEGMKRPEIIELIKSS